MRASMTTAGAAAAVTLLLLGAYPAPAATNHVAGSGSDTNSGATWAAAWATINHAAANTAAGDTVLVSNGTYSLTTTISVTNGITVRGLNGHGATIVNGGGSVRCFYLSHADAVVQGLTITNGYRNEQSYGGGGVYCAGAGTVRDCVVVGNVASDRGAGVTLYAGGRVRNCLITGNSCAGTGYGGGVYIHTSGAIESSTISGNSGGNTGGVYFNGGAASIKNSVLYGNQSLGSPNVGGSGTFSYTCVWPARAGTGNTANDPFFTDAAAGNYRLLPGSACTNAGNNDLGWMSGAEDLDGNARISDANVDMGAYEYVAGALQCNFVAGAPDGPAPHDVVFTAYAAGTNTSGLVYAWDFDNDTIVDASGSSSNVVTNTYAAGTYGVKLTVTNAVGESASFTRLDYVHVGHGAVYASTNGGNVSPYTNWATAATSIQDAIDIGSFGTVVWVTNGTYVLSSTISITDGITVRSVNGHATTVVNGNNAVRCFYLNHADAVVDGFTITRGRKSASGHGGGGVYCYSEGGTVQNCMITNNWASDRGAGVTLYTGGTLRNCVIAGNSATTYGGGLYTHSTDPVVENCTITGNTGTYGGGVFANGNATLRNTIIYFNTAANGPNTYSTGIYTYCCTIDPVKAGTGNISGDPLFADAGQGDYHLTPASPCTNAGSNQAWMPAAKDLDGNGRVSQGTVDIGAYEYTLGPLACDFTADAAEGMAPHTAVLTATVVGSNTTGVVYMWDYETDGTNDVQGADRKVVTNTFAAGTYTVTLTVTNQPGELATATRAAYIVSAPLVAYVSKTGTDTPPYDTWGTAASNIQSAVDVGVDGTAVRVGSGTYVLSSQVEVAKGITVESANGARTTVVDGNGSVRGFYLTHANAVVDGFTITNCQAAGGAGVYLFGAGLVRNCILEGNTSSSYGGAARCEGGGIVRNCLMKNNRCGGNSGAGVYIVGSGGTVENCTIVYNTAGNGGGGIYNNTGAGRVRNTIMAHNTASPTWPDQNYLGAGQIDYSCTPVMVHPGTSNIMADPLFVDVAADYRLQETSPCVDTGTQRSWMTPGTPDLAGSPRVAGGEVDMGAYEWQPPRGSLILIR